MESAAEFLATLFKIAEVRLLSLDLWLKYEATGQRGMLNAPALAQLNNPVFNGVRNFTLARWRSLFTLKKRRGLKAVRVLDDSYSRVHWKP